MATEISPGVTQYGDQSYQFGFNDPAAETIADSVGLKPQTLSVSGEAEFSAEAKNLHGLTEAYVQGDQKFTFTMSGFVVDMDLFSDNGATFTFDGRFYIVQSTKFDISNTEFTKGEVTGVSFPLITS